MIKGRKTSRKHMQAKNEIVLLQISDMNITNEHLAYGVPMMHF
jgi:hypothetical protein